MADRVDLGDRHAGKTLASALAMLTRSFAAERLRWPLWLPVGIGTGIGLYFALPLEPIWWSALPVLGLAGVLGILGRRWQGASIAAVVLAMAALGFAAAQWRTAQVAAPVLEKRWGPAILQGRVVAVDVLPKGRRLLLDRLAAPGLAPDGVPANARIRVHGRPETDPIAPGDRISVRAVLLPPPGPAAPGAFDFQRYAWFQGLGAVGYAVARTEKSAGSDSRGAVELWLARIRHAAATRARAAVDGPAGAVAAALLTGDRKAIPEPILIAMRDSGLAHLLAISGLHIGLVAGLVFFAVRLLLALVPPVALRRPIKKWAAVAALVVAFGYLLLSGATVPTQRAFLMVGLVLLAVLLDRTAISMRLVAWAAGVILLLAPESLLSASFQMSFAAVVALVAAYEYLGPHLSAWRRREAGAWWVRPVAYVSGVGLTTLIAGTATAIFAVYHFNRVAVFGLAANLLAVPVMALWIMPWGVLALLLMPLGLEGVALIPMGWGIEVMIAVAETVAAWPGSVSLVPAMPVAGLALAVFGGLWLCLWQTRWRLLGLIGLAAALGSIAMTRPADILVTEDGKLMAVRAADGRYLLSSKRAGRFAAEGWLRQAGQREPADWPKTGTTADDRLTCDPLGCLYRSGGLVTALVFDERALAEDCRVADVVVSREPVRLPCPSARVGVDRFDLWRHGAHALWIEGAKVTVRTVNGLRGARPWVPRRPPPPAAARKD